MKIKEDDLYISKSLLPTITFKLPEPTEFNCIRLEEVIQLGHRVRGFVIEYLKDGKWETLLQRECIGFCRSEYFDNVITDQIRIRITMATALPALRYFGVYNAPQHILDYASKEKREPMNLTELPTAKIIKCEDGLEVDFGGIYSFNKVIFDGTGVPSFEILAFNGTRYDSIYKGKNGASPEMCTFKEIEDSYKLKLVLYDCEIGNDRNIKVLYD